MRDTGCDLRISPIAFHQISDSSHPILQTIGRHLVGNTEHVAGMRSHDEQDFLNVAVKLFVAYLRCEIHPRNTTHRMVAGVSALAAQS